MRVKNYTHSTEHYIMACSLEVLAVFKLCGGLWSKNIEMQAVSPNSAE